MNRIMRIVHVTLGLDVGGQEKLLVEFARHRSPHHSVQVVSLTTRGELAEDLEACGCPVTALEQPPGFRPGIVLRLAACLRRLEADVVHTHDDRANIYGAPAARLAGVPKVVHTRHHQGTSLSQRQRSLVRLVSLANDHFVCISRDSARIALEQGISRHRVVTIHNGIDLTRFDPVGPDPEGYAVLVARLSPEKNVETLLDAAAVVLRERPDFRLWIAGDGPERAALERRAGQLGLGDAVRFLGTVREIPALLAGARLFALSSITEGISLTLLEAMARGLPIVATDVGGNPEVVEAGRTGFLVPSRNPAALAQSILALWTRPELCARIGKAGRSRVEEYFDVHRMVSRYETLYLSGLSALCYQPTVRQKLPPAVPAG